MPDQVGEGTTEGDNGTNNNERGSEHGAGARQSQRPSVTGDIQQQQEPMTGITSVPGTTPMRGEETEANSGDGRTEDTTPILDEVITVEPEEMFIAVVTIIKRSSGEQPRDEWVTTIAELYAIIHRSVSIEEDIVPPNKQRYPKLRGDEKALLYNLFREMNVIGNGTYAAWKQCITSVTQDLLNTRWTFKNIMYSRISKARWARTPPLNQWAEKVKSGMTADASNRASGSEAGASSGHYDTFMFNPACFSKPDIVKFRAICEQVHATQGDKHLREATADEWTVIVGIAEGTIACRRMPDFLSSVFDSQERLRLHTTIQQQVEGELVMQLRGRARVKHSRQQTRLIKKDILLDAAKARINVHELLHMLNLAKTIAYNDIKRSIHIFFFDRATAAKFQGLQVPFRGVMYSLGNVHRPDTGSVWDRQLNSDGVRRTTQREYEVEIHNLTRFTDIGRLTAFLTKHLAVPFELVNMDSFTPNSMRTTAWTLRMKSAECPEYLRGIVRIIWLGRMLILKHSYAKKQLQCFRCGNLGHLMARCQMSDEALKGVGSRVADDQQVASLDSLAKSFTSPADMKRSTEARLKVKEEAYRQEEAALEPVAPPKQELRTTEQTKVAADVGQHSQPNASFAPPQSARAARTTGTQWTKVSLARGRTLYAHPAALQRKGIKVTTHYSELFDADDEDPAEEEKSEEHPPARDVVELSSGSEQGLKPKPVITAAAKAKLHLVKTQLPKLPETFQLIALKQRQHGVIGNILQELRDSHGSRLPLHPDSLDEAATFEQIESSLGMKEVSTPASGNCMAMAISQALADQNLAAKPATMEQLTAAIKRGICWAGQLNCMEQFDHFTRTTTLVNKGRRWEGMGPKESSKQFR